MKKILKIIISTILLALIAFMGYKVFTKINNKKEVAERIKTIPKFSYETITGQQFSEKDLKENTSTIFLFFNSECEHCQNEAEQIRDNFKKFTTAQLVFISFEDPKKIMEFANKYKLINHDNITFLCDRYTNSSTTFNINAFPTILIYNKKKTLLEKIKGQVKTEMIIKKLKSNDN